MRWISNGSIGIFMGLMAGVWLAPGCDVATADGGGRVGADANAPPTLCAAPTAPLMDALHVGATLRFTLSDAPDGISDTLADPLPDALPAPQIDGLPDPRIEVGVADGDSATQPDLWTLGDRLQLGDTPGEVTVFARRSDSRCASTAPFRHTYQLVTAYAPGADQPETTAVAYDDPGITGWATGWVRPVAWGERVDDAWRVPANAVGPATDETLQVCSLGAGGVITMTFDAALRDKDGPDLAVFENSFSVTFLELAFVEVSTDGEDFARFPSAFLGESPIGAWGVTRPEWTTGLAGKYPAGYGTPFDLAELVNDPLVTAGVVDLATIHYVRIVDIIGDGRETDSFGDPIYDPTPTEISAGFDLNGIAALN